MIVKKALKVVDSFTPVCRSAYGFGRTCFKVYNARSQTKALIARVKKIVIYCTLPIFKAFNFIYDLIIVVI